MPAAQRRVPRARADGRRGSALHPLHLRLHREAQGRAAHHGRLPGLRQLHARARLRLPARRHLLVHRRHRLGDGPHLHRLRPAGQRRDHADVRGRAQLSRTSTASGRWSTSTGSTSSTPRRPRSARSCARARSRSKKPAAQSLRLLGTVGEPINPEAWLWYYRVVGDERCPIVDTWWQTETGGILISPLPGAIAHEARLGHPAAPRREPVLVDDDGQAAGRARPRATSCIDARWPGHDAHGLRRPRALRADLLLALPGQVLHRRRRPPRRRRLLLDHRARGRRAQRLRPPDGHRRGRERARRAPRWPRRPWSACRTTSRARASTRSSR